jgi:plastocyanin
MKKFLLFAGAIFLTSLQATFTQTTHTITAAGLAYTPATLTVQVGDIVVFDVTAFHPTLQVSEETWNANGLTPLSGGFDFPNGSGTVEITGTGTIYYVCTAHINSGMKGRIEVAQVSSLQNVAAQNSFEVYPNPVTENRLNIRFANGIPSGLIINIYDLTGKQITDGIALMDNSGQKSVTVVFNYLKEGSYILEIKSNTVTYATKIVVR